MVFVVVAAQPQPCYSSMTPGQVEEVDKQQIAGACLIDLSAAFNVVDAKLLKAKLGQDMPNSGFGPL